MMIDVGGKRPKLTVDIELRTPQVDYLERIAERDGVSLSKAFGAILEGQRAAVVTGPLRTPKKARKHFVITTANAAILERLSVRSGLFKGDIARRLIDEAAANDDRLADDLSPSPSTPRGASS